MTSAAVDALAYSTYARRSFRQLIGWRHVALYFVLFSISAVPVLGVHLLPLRDFQNHLGRMLIIAAGPQDHFFSHFYHINWAPIGAFAIDLMLPPLVKAVGVEWTAKIFLLAIFFLLSSGAIFLNWALTRRPSWWPFVSFLLLYNAIVTWGFVNYLFGLGLFLWILGLWFCTEQWSWPIRIVCFSWLGYVLVICHLYTFGLYGAAVISAEIATHWKQHRHFWLWHGRRFWLAMAQLIMPIALFVSTSPSAGNLVVGAVFRINPKLYGLGSLIYTGRFWLDFSLCILFYASFALLIWRSWIRVDARLFGMLGCLVILFPVWPDYILGGAYAAFRLPVAIAFIAVAATTPANFLGDRRRRRAALGLVAVLILVHAIFTTGQWRQFQREYDLIANAVEMVPSEAKLLVAIPQDNQDYEANNPPIAYAPLLIGTQRHIFVNGSFVWPQDNSSIALTAPYRSLQTEHAWFPEYYPEDLAVIRAAPSQSNLSPFREKVLEYYNYLFVADETRFGVSLGSKFQRIAKEGRFTLYKVHSGNSADAE